MFYQCKKCNRIWNYPIKKCPFCFEDLIKMESKKAKVIGVSKVNIPTIQHPHFPYYALVLEDENKNKWAHKSTKEMNINEEMIFSPSSDKEAVALWRIKYDFNEAIEKVVNLLDGLKLKEGLKILILPALVSPSHAYFRDNTSPEFLNAVLDFLVKKKPEIKICGQSFDDIPIEASAQRSGLLDVCLKYKITPLDLSQSNFVKQNKLEISEEALNADLILNLPILKMGRAAAAENLLKLLSKNNYLGLKYLDSEETIVSEVNQALADKIVVIAEANVVQRPDKFTKFLGLVLAGQNSLNLDKIFDEIIMSKNPCPLLQNLNIENIPLVGRELKEFQQNAEIL
ncbi:MAG: DUF362 domain-containing protein [Candidatus Pacebacteria bacterium]|nr:DUF362 domain-containing protein [Candidatus Paceibacterota bacterium]